MSYILTGNVTLLGVSSGVTLPIAAASLPLPNGAATSALQPNLHTDGGALAHVTNFPALQTVSVVSLPLPAGAATAANQPVPGTAGNPGAQVLSIQGVTGGTPQPVLQAGGTGTDCSATTAASTAATTNLLLTIPATAGRAFVEVQNQSGSTVSLVRDDGSGNNQTLILLGPGAGAGTQGAGWSSATFKGRVRVFGPAGSQVAAYQE